MKITRRQLRQIIKEALQLEKSDRLFPHSDLPQPSDPLPDKVNRLITLMAVMNDSLPDRIDDLENQMGYVISTLESQDDSVLIFKQDAEDIEVEEEEGLKVASPR